MFQNLKIKVLQNASKGNKDFYHKYMIDVHHGPFRPQKGYASVVLYTDNEFVGSIVVSTNVANRAELFFPFVIPKYRLDVFLPYLLQAAEQFIRLPANKKMEYMIANTNSRRIDPILVDGYTKFFETKLKNNLRKADQVYWNINGNKHMQTHMFYFTKKIRNVN
jgi:hypothetical protein